MHSIPGPKKKNWKKERPSSNSYLNAALLLQLSESISTFLK
jgi:hypothetical protein